MRKKLGRDKELKENVLSCHIKKEKKNCKKKSIINTNKMMFLSNGIQFPQMIREISLSSSSQFYTALKSFCLIMFSIEGIQFTL